MARYIQWLKRYGHHLTHYAVLDDIGDPQVTWDNQLRMEDAGLSPIPCYHYGEPYSWLEKYIDAYDYIAIGGMVPIGKVALLDWLDEVWGVFLSNARGEPICKVHGFGMTTFTLMERYPWYSVDSSSWLYGAKAGAILFEVNGTMTRITVANDSPARHEAGRHMETLTVAEYKRLKDEIIANGFNPALVFNSGVQRNLVNIKQFDKWAKRWTAPRVGFQPSLLNQARYYPDAKGETHTKLDLYFAAERGGVEEKALLPYNRMFTYYAQQKKLSRDFRFVLDVMEGRINPDAYEPIPF